MTVFQQIALLLTALWLAAVLVRFRRSTIALAVGLFVIGVLTLMALLTGWINLGKLGLGFDHPWWLTLGSALVGLGVAVAYSPLADWIASRWFKQPPTLEAFGEIQQSRWKLIAGIAAAWVLGGFLEELVTRGIVLSSVEAGLAPWIDRALAAGVALCVAATGAGLMHLYQGPRAAVIIAQLSALFGLLFLVSGQDLWAVILCHGLYDTIAFVRFANRTSKYSDPNRTKEKP
jgi:membrane protease YdiL (CAAX protease family)